MHNHTYKHLILNVKKILKTRSLTYKQLAAKLSMSESGVKKIFLAQDASYSRICELCQALDISLGELLAMESHWQPKKITFTAAQEEYLLDDETALEVFFLLAYDDLNPKETASALQISETTLSAIIRKLDELDLIKWMPGDRIEFPRDGVVLWEQGELVRHIKKKWGGELLQEGLTRSSGNGSDKSLQKPEQQGDCQFQLKYLKLTEASQRDLQTALTQLLEEFQQRSRREMIFYGNRQLPGTKIMTVVSSGSFVSGASCKTPKD